MWMFVYSRGEGYDEDANENRIKKGKGGYIKKNDWVNLKTERGRVKIKPEIITAFKGFKKKSTARAESRKKYRSALLGFNIITTS